MKIRDSLWFRLSNLSLFMLICSLPVGDAQALELDWSGQFWSEYNFVHNYAMDGSDLGITYDASRDKGGYYVGGGGTRAASFQSLFVRLRPKVVVNDNIYIKSEWWVGDPVFGFFGSGLPYSSDQSQFYSSQSRGSFITAQRIWGEFVTDIGTFQVGRVPLNWGLGIVWNSGDNLWDRYMSTGDAVRWIAKFGSFSFIPSIITNSTGNSIGGTCTVSGTNLCTPGIGAGGVSDYSILLKYENTEDELEAGVNVIKRIGGTGQDPNAGVKVPTGATSAPGPINMLTYDLFARKKFNHLTLGAEVPIVSGTLGGSNYSALAVATEIDWKPTDVWEFLLKAGYAPGQPNPVGTSIDTFKAFYFNPNYHIGMIMSNYQLANFAGAQTQNNPNLTGQGLKSPYDNPIVNAAYISLMPSFRPWDKWTFRPGFVYAQALQTAVSGTNFYNYWTKTVPNTVAPKDQGNSLGWEADLGVTFQWDEYFQFNLDTGIFFPGNFYAFSNTASDNNTSPVFGTSFRIGVNF